MKAIKSGALLSFVDIKAGDIDYFTDKLALNLPNYLPADAASDDKAETVDFYAVTARLDSEDESIENDYAYLRQRFYCYRLVWQYGNIL